MSLSTKSVRAEKQSEAWVKGLRKEEDFEPSAAATLIRLIPNGLCAVRDIKQLLRADKK